jgi:hypothetical protein
MSPYSSNGGEHEEHHAETNEPHRILNSITLRG